VGFGAISLSHLKPWKLSQLNARLATDGTVNACNHSNGGLSIYLRAIPIVFGSDLKNKVPA
jgi:hypothetical protein